LYQFPTVIGSIYGNERTHRMSRARTSHDSSVAR